MSGKYQNEILKEVENLSEEQMMSLLKMIRIFKESLFKQRTEDFNLQEEFEEWDSLSDEAMKTFENTLQ